MVSSTPPGADFFDEFFNRTPRAQQASFLRALFIKHAALRSSYYSFVWPKYIPIETLRKRINKKYPGLQNKIKKYDWRSCYVIDPVAEDYYDMITGILEEQILRDIISMISVNCSIGLLTEAIADIRVIEKALDIDWEQLPEPVSEAEDLTRFFFEMVEGSFLVYICDYVHAPEMIDNALELIEAIIEEGNVYSNNEEVWGDVGEALRMELVRY